MTPKMSRTRETCHRALQIAVICGLITLITVEIGGFAGRSPGEEDDTAEPEALRNERSTPRSFILPATPGVALRQERERGELKQLSEIAGCVPQFKERGIEFEGLPLSSNLAFKGAVAKFQRDNRLPVTGRIDEFTEEALRCRK